MQLMQEVTALRELTFVHEAFRHFTIVIDTRDAAQLRDLAETVPVLDFDNFF